VPTDDHPADPARDSLPKRQPGTAHHRPVAPTDTVSRPHSNRPGTSSSHKPAHPHPAPTITGLLHDPG